MRRQISMRPVGDREEMLLDGIIYVALSKNDLEGFSDFIRSIEGVEVALVIYEVDHNTCRINFRSKGNFVVNVIAKSFGGGGHAFASGAVVNESLETAMNIVINNSKKMIQEQIEKIK